MQNVIIKGKDNPVIFEFAFTGEFETDGLNNFATDITVKLGDEVYSVNDGSPKLFVDDKNTLRLVIGDTTALTPGYYTPVIMGYSVTYNDGYELNGENVRELTDIIVKG